METGDDRALDPRSNWHAPSERQEGLERPAELAGRDEQQRKRDCAVGQVDGVIERRAALVILLRHVGADESHLHGGVQVAAQHSVHQWRPAALVGRVDVRTPRAEGLCGLGVAMGR